MVNKIGILGGMGSRAGILLMQKIIDRCPAEKDQDFPEIILHNNSRIPDRTRAIIYREESPVNEMLRSIGLFNANDVELILMACITSHYYLDQMQLQAKGLIVHPALLLRKHILNQFSHVRKIGLLATTGTIRSGIIQRIFDDTAVEIVTLDPVNQEALFMKSVYGTGGLKSSKISKETIDLFARTLPILQDSGAELLIGGCSEVQIAIRKLNGQVNLPYIDLIDLMADEAVKQYYPEEAYAH